MITDAQYNQLRCPTCGARSREQVVPSHIVCDGCGKTICETGDVKTGCLVTTVFKDRKMWVEEHESRAQDHEYCSWRCLLGSLTDGTGLYAVRLPMLAYADGVAVADEFLAIVRAGLEKLQDEGAAKDTG